MKKLSSYILHYWYAYLFAIVCLLLQVGLDMLAPQVTRRIVDDVIGEGALDRAHSRQIFLRHGI